jgi:mono/diheme cytochrome c family protein
MRQEGVMDKEAFVPILLGACLIFGGTKFVWSQPAVDVGKAQYITSCAPCHGIAGKADGPVAESLSTPPTDLTALSKENNGVFPISRVFYSIHGAMQTSAHGSREMPVWGNVFSRELEYPGGTLSDVEVKSITDRRILALIEYISTMQVNK